MSAGARLVWALLALALVAVAFWLLRFLLTPFLLALLMSYALGPIVNQLESYRVPRWAAVLICLGIGVGVAFTLCALLWPSLDAWLRQAPKIGEKSIFEVRLDARLADWQAYLTHTYPRLDWATLFAKWRSALEGQRKDLMETLPARALAAFAGAGTFVLAPIIGIFLLLDGATMQKALIALVPNRYFETVLVLLHRVDRQVAGYLRGAASEAGLVIVILSLVLFLAGMPNAFLFACIYGVVNVVPLAGPIIGTSVGLIYSLLEPNAPGAGTLLLSYGVVYVIDAMFINPLVVGKNLNLHPLTVIVGIAVGANAGGIFGMLVSLPVIAIGNVVVRTVSQAVRAQALRPQT